MILHELVSYEVLRVIWWALMGVLLIGYAVTDGFDLGIGTLLPSSHAPISSAAPSSTPSAPSGKATRSG